MPPREHTIISASWFLMYCGTGLTMMMPLVFKGRGLPPDQIGFLAAIYAASGAVTQVGAGRLSDRAGLRKPFFVAPALALALCYWAISVAHGFGQYALIYVVAGASYHAITTAMAALITDWSASRGRTASAYAWSRLWGSVGFIFSLIALSWWLGNDKLVLHAIAAFFVLMAIAAMFASEPRHHLEAAIAISGHMRELLTDRNLMVFLGCAFLFKISESATMAYLALRLSALGGSRQLVGWAFAMNAICEIPLMWWAGPLSERIGRRPILLAAFLVLPLRLIAYACLPSAAWVFPVQLFHGFTFSFMTIGSVAYVADRAPRHLTATALGLLGMTVAAAMSIGPFVGGLLSRMLGLGRLFFALAVIVGVGTVVFTLFVAESRPESRLRRGGPIGRLASAPIIRMNLPLP